MNKYLPLVGFFNLGSTAISVVTPSSSFAAIRHRVKIGQTASKAARRRRTLTAPKCTLRRTMNKQQQQNIEDWLKRNPPDDLEECFILKQAVETETDMGPYTAQQIGDELHLTSMNDPSDVLVLSDGTEEAYLLHVLDRDYNPDSELDIDDAYHLQRNLENPHA